MPRTERWFKVSEDINTDPLVLELIAEFKLAGLRIYLELHAMANRNDGVIPDYERGIIVALNMKCCCKTPTTIKVLSYLKDAGKLPQSYNSEVLKLPESLKSRDRSLYIEKTEKKEENTPPPPPFGS